MSVQPAELNHLSSVKTDADKAKEYKEQLAELLKPVCVLMDAAKKDKLDFVFNIQPDAMGRHFVGVLKMQREF
jgi:hypothetical protein